MIDERKDCPMRHENGNCLPCGGFCLAVSDEICHALLYAYEHGYGDCVDYLWGNKYIRGSEDERNSFYRETNR